MEPVAARMGIRSFEARLQILGDEMFSRRSSRELYYGGVHLAFSIHVKESIEYSFELGTSLPTLIQSAPQSVKSAVPSEMGWLVGEKPIENGQKVTEIYPNLPCKR